MAVRWAILTGEYPPQPGGVADYTCQLAAGLAAAGDAVTVFAPPHQLGKEADDAGVAVVRLPDRFGPRGLCTLGHALARERPARILVQYVPHAFGWKAMNLPFAAWLAARARRLAPVWVMFHEVCVPFRWRPVKSAVLGAAHAVMARLVAGAADRVFVPIPAWAARLWRLCPGAKPAEWLPVPSNIPAAAVAVRSASGTVIGHFGTYGPATAELLESALVALLDRSADRSAVLLGRGAATFRDRLAARHPALADRVVAPGERPPEEVAARLRGCDVLLQPYTDGISSRRTSAMSGLANGVPVVSNLGELSDPVWLGLGWPSLAPGPDPAAVAAAAETTLAMPPESRHELGRAGAALYREQFALAVTLARLRDTP